MRGWGLLAVLFAAPSCVSPSSSSCESGLACPSNRLCDQFHQLCVFPEQRTVCEGRSDGAYCEFSGTEGVCHAETCLPDTCGDGLVGRYEACDDGNVVGGDDCSADCSSSLTCGNGILDPDEGCDCGDEATVVPIACTLNNSDFDDRASCHENCTPLCGDGVTQTFEACDSGPPHGDCLGRGFSRGRLECTDTCSVIAADCSNFGYVSIASPGLPGTPIEGVEVLDDGTFVAVGGRFRVLLHNGSWTAETDPLGTNWAAVSGNSQFVFAVGLFAPGVSQGTPRAASFDGSTWTDIPAPITLDVFTDVLALSPTQVVVVGSSLAGAGVIWEWNGESWDQVVSDGAAPFSSLAPLGAGNVIAVDRAGGARRRVNGEWSGTEEVASGVSLNAVVNIGGTLYAGGKDSGAVLFADQGSGWTPVDFPGALGQVCEVVGASADALVAIVAATDCSGPQTQTVGFDGRSWIPDLGPAGLVSAVADGPQMVFGGQNFVAFALVEPGWRELKVPLPLPTLTAADGAVYIVGSTGIGRWRDGLLEVVANYLLLTLGGPLGSFALAEEDVFYWTGADIYRYKDGAAPSDPYVTVGGVVIDLWADRPDRIFYATPSALGDNLSGDFVEQLPALETDEYFTTLAGRSGGAEVWAATNHGRLWKRVGAGWVVDFNTGQYLGSLWVAADGQVFAGGEGGVVWRNSAGAWNPQRIETDQRILAIDGSSSTDVIAVTASSIHHFNGVRWSVFDSAGREHSDVVVVGDEIYSLTFSKTATVLRLQRSTSW